MSRFIDDKGRFFGKISIIDVLVVLLIVAVGVFVYARTREPGGRDAVVRTTLTVEKVRDATFAQFKIGDVVHDDAGNTLGTVEKIDIGPTPTEVPTALGDLLKQPSPVFSDVSVVVKGRATVSNSSIKVGGTPLRVGKVVIMVGPGYEVKTQIMGVEEVK